MGNATPETRHDDGDVLRFDRPDWMSDEKWAEIKAAVLALLAEGPHALHAAVLALREEASE